ncbi:VQ motif-containing protein domain-containing protein [Forsythia ovata]|uniref:VQ motif-containing protein domain-containing protein n=1 Tax=Forsythia ovata TaxID=205694 RepID=A0ABD1VK73_9LAMI
MSRQNKSGKVRTGGSTSKILNLEDKLKFAGPVSNRLQRIRPPPLAPMNRPRLPIHTPMPMPMPALAHPIGHHPNNFARSPPLPAQYGQPSPPVLPPLTPTDV